MFNLFDRILLFRLFQDVRGIRKQFNPDSCTAGVLRERLACNKEVLAMLSNEMITGLMIPLIGTSAGGACVFFMKRGLDINIQKALTGFAAGVMVAASVWSLIIPAMEQSSGLGKLSFVPAFIGFWLGVLFLLILDNIIPHLHLNAESNEGPVSHLARTTMMVLAVVLHNIPEGMAVGVLLFATGFTVMMALDVALG